jgi:hypothetical protein
MVKVEYIRARNWYILRVPFEPSISQEGAVEVSPDRSDRQAVWSLGSLSFAGNSVVTEAPIRALNYHVGQFSVTAHWLPNGGEIPFQGKGDQHRDPRRHWSAASPLNLGFLFYLLQSQDRPLSLVDPVESRVCSELVPKLLTLLQNSCTRKPPRSEPHEPLVDRKP